MLVDMTLCNMFLGCSARKDRLLQLSLPALPTSPQRCGSRYDVLRPRSERLASMTNGWESRARTCRKLISGPRGRQILNIAAAV